MFSCTSSMPCNLPVRCGFGTVSSWCVSCLFMALFFLECLWSAACKQNNGISRSCASRFARSTMLRAIFSQYMPMTWPCLNKSVVSSFLQFSILRMRSWAKWFYFTSYDPHHDIYRFSYWIFLLANFLAFYLTYLLAFYLAFSCGILSGKSSGILSGIFSGILSDISSGILSGKSDIFYLAYFLAFYLTYFLAFYPAFYLVYFLAYILTYLLAFYLVFYLAYLLAYVLTYILTYLWHSIWHSIWQIF